MPGPHDKIVAEAAKAVLGPLGFRRKGRSRVWLFDHGWWLTVVEFQPSAWSKGCYLNVAAHWLWSPGPLGQLSFDYGGRVEAHVQYHTDEQFTPEAIRLAEIAEHEVRSLARQLMSLNVTAKVLLAKARETARDPILHPGWAAYNAGVALGLTGQLNDAAEMFASVMHGLVPGGSVLYTAAERMAQLVDNSIEFECMTRAQITAQRASLKLPPSQILLI